MILGNSQLAPFGLLGNLQFTRQNPGSERFLPKTPVITSVYRYFNVILIDY